MPLQKSQGKSMELGSNFGMDLSQITYEEANVDEYLKEYNAMYFDCGRSALKFLSQKLKQGKILIPSFICKSVVLPFKDFKIDYYLINEQLEIDIEDFENKIDESVTVVYIMHYFGILQKTEVLDYVKKKQEEYQFVIIEDSTHSFLTKKFTIGDYQVCSLRKWFAIPDGGVLYAKKELEDKVNEYSPKLSRMLEAMLLKQLYLEEKADTNLLYREMFAEQEKKLDEQKEIYAITKLSSVLLRCINIDKIRKCRKENWHYLKEKLKNPYIVPFWGDIDKEVVPFVFLVRTENKDAFRKYMMMHRIYCASHWPIEIEEQQSISENQLLQKSLLSLPIDQRYGRKEMDYMIYVINSYGR